MKILIRNARGCGYKRFVEPCAGAFAMSHLAAETGWPRDCIDTSDITLFTTVMGYAITGESLAPLCIKADGLENEDLSCPAIVLWVQMVLRMSMKANHSFYKDLIRDLSLRKEAHLDRIRKRLDRAKSILWGMRYRPMCMWAHLEECLDDPKYNRARFPLAVGVWEHRFRSWIT